MKPTRKTLILIGLLYGTIIGLINFMGYFVVSTQNVPTIMSETFDFWLNYIDEHSVMISVL